MKSIGNKNAILLGLGFQILQLAWYGFGADQQGVVQGMIADSAMVWDQPFMDSFSTFSTWSLKNSQSQEQTWGQTQALSITLNRIPSFLPLPLPLWSVFGPVGSARFLFILEHTNLSLRSNGYRKHCGSHSLLHSAYAPGEAKEPLLQDTST